MMKISCRGYCFFLLNIWLVQTSAQQLEPTTVRTIRLKEYDAILKRMGDFSSVSLVRPMELSEYSGKSFLLTMTFDPLITLYDTKEKKIKSTSTIERAVTGYLASKNRHSEELHYLHLYQDTLSVVSYSDVLLFDINTGKKIGSYSLPFNDGLSFFKSKILVNESSNKLKVYSMAGRLESLIVLPPGTLTDEIFFNADSMFVYDYLKNSISSIHIQNLNEPWKLKVTKKLQDDFYLVSVNRRYFILANKSKKNLPYKSNEFFLMERPASSATHAVRIVSDFFYHDFLDLTVIKPSAEGAPEPIIAPYVIVSSSDSELFIQFQANKTLYVKAVPIKF